MRAKLAKAGQTETRSEIRPSSFGRICLENSLRFRTLADFIIMLNLSNLSQEVLKVIYLMTCAISCPLMSPYFNAKVPFLISRSNSLIISTGYFMNGKVSHGAFLEGIQSVTAFLKLFLNQFHTSDSDHC